MTIFVLSFSMDILALTLKDIKNEKNLPSDLTSLKTGQNPSSIAINSVTKKIYVANSDINTVSVIDTNSIKPTNIQVGIKPVDIAINEITNKIYVANSGSDTVSIINGINDTKIADVHVGDEPISVVTSLNGNYVTYVANSGSDTVSVIDGINNTKIAEFSVGKYPLDLALNSENNLIYVANSFSDSISIINGTTYKKMNDIPVGNFPTFFSWDAQNNLIYVINSESNTLSVIETLNNTRISDITLGLNPTVSSPTSFGDKIYVANSGSDTVSIINATNNMMIADVPVGDNPAYLAVDENRNVVYVANYWSDTVSIINATNNTKIADVPVGDNPAYLAVDEKSGIVYVANFGTDTISLIDSSGLLKGVIFNVNPSDSGHIKCDNITVPSNKYIYINYNTHCAAEPNKGFRFDSWVENSEKNSKRTINTTKIEYSPLTSLGALLGWQINDTSATFDVTQFGNFTSNFKEVPPPLPPEYWIPLYGIIASTIVGWSIPSIVAWTRRKGELKKLNHFYQRITDLHKDGKLDEKDIESLDKLRNDITHEYSKGKLNKEQFTDLEDEISLSYEKIYRDNIEFINNSSNKNITEKQVDVIKGTLEDAYASGNLNELHYNLLKDKLNLLKQTSKNKFDDNAHPD